MFCQAKFIRLKYEIVTDYRRKTMGDSTNGW